MRVVSDPCARREEPACSEGWAAPCTMRPSGVVDHSPPCWWPLEVRSRTKTCQAQTLPLVTCPPKGIIGGGRASGEQRRPVTPCRAARQGRLCCPAPPLCPLHPLQFILSQTGPDDCQAGTYRPGCFLPTNPAPQHESCSTCSRVAHSLLHSFIHSVLSSLLHPWAGRPALA